MIARKTNPKDKYRLLVSTENLSDLSTNAALRLIALLVDLSLDLRKTEGLDRAIRLSEELQERQLTARQSATSHYFLANAWANRKQLTKADDHVWAWEQQETEMEIFHLRSALKKDFSGELPKERRCQIMTNLANLFSEIGRSVESIEYWDRSLAIMPSFAMARGNKGYGFASYARSLYDQGHAAVFLKFAHADLESALSSKLHEDAKEVFAKQRQWIESVLSPELINKDIDLHNFSLGSSQEEILYRQWCLENRLFLNPLNDLGPFPIAARDVLTTPAIVTGIREGPYYQGFFNQMKQEFVSSRRLYYEGISAQQPHFSDRDVLLYNTLDYPSYSLAIEKVKAAFRMTYSLSDKIAYFLNEYLDLSVRRNKVYFKTIWYTLQSKSKGLRPNLQQRKNWPLRGLFWLSKDLFEDKPGFKEFTEPDAQELYDIRNHLEHRYLKLHDDLWPGPSSDNKETVLGLTDTLAFSMYRRDFEAKTLRVIKMMRAAMIYLSLAIHCEEKQRAGKIGPDCIVPGIPLDVWENDWKL